MIFSFFNEFPSRPVGCKTWIYLFHNMSSLTLLIGKIVRDIFKMHQVSFLLLWNNIQCACYVNVEKLRDTSIVWKENISTFLLSIKCWLLQKISGVVIQNISFHIHICSLDLKTSRLKRGVQNFKMHEVQYSKFCQIYISEKSFLASRQSCYMETMYCHCLFVH